MTLFYDDRCRLCRAFVRLILAADTSRRLHTAPLDSPQADRVLGELDDEARYGAFHLAAEGRIWSGGDAVGPLLELLDPIRPVGRFLRRSPRARRFASAAYDLVARHRGRIGRYLPKVGDPPR